MVGAAIVQLPEECTGTSQGVCNVNLYLNVGQENVHLNMGQQIFAKAIWVNKIGRDVCEGDRVDPCRPSDYEGSY